MPLRSLRVDNHHSPKGFLLALGEQLVMGTNQWPGLLGQVEEARVGGVGEGGNHFLNGSLGLPLVVST